MDLTTIKNIILWASWVFIVGATIYILLRGKVVLTLVKGSIIGKLAMGLMVGFFIESYSVLGLCTVLLNLSEKNINAAWPFLLVWFITFIFAWVVMHNTRISAEKIMSGK